MPGAPGICPKVESNVRVVLPVWYVMAMREVTPVGNDTAVGLTASMIRLWTQ
jgi:hypothetical protein